MKRRLFALFVASFLAATWTITEASPPSEASAKATKIACKKVGAKRKVKKVSQVCRKVGKNRVWVVVKTRPAAPTATTAPQAPLVPATTVTAPTATTAPQAPWVPAKTVTINSESCKLPDERDPALVNSPRSLGFPLNQTGSKATGTINLALVAIDFPDFASQESELAKLDEQLRLFDEWLLFQSGGRLKANWQFPRKFYRMPRNAAAYGVVGFDPSTHRELIGNAVDASNPDVDYSAVDELFIYMADSLTESEPGTDPFQGILSQIGVVNFQTNEGTIAHVKGSGTVSKREQYGGIKPTLWALWAHDLLHTIGVEGHNPVESFTLESEDYLNNVVSGWNQWLLGWMREDQIACLDRSTINGMEVDLVPLQSPSTGYRTAIVPITKTRAIVVEAHRSSGYAANLGASGVLVYLMDTKNVPPYAERENTALIGSKFLDPNTVTAGTRARVGKGRNSALMLPGEFAEFEGLRVTFSRTGDFDKVTFSLTG